jgi:NAD(P)-dependent dehydrogenase (short-subunit alcohol dehydrogenase family)
MGELEGKVAVITGAGSGMGRASARVFVREGAKVVVADISGRQDDTAAELGDAALAVRCDVTKEAEVEATIAAAVEAFGKVDAVLNVAGIGGGGPLEDIDMAWADQLLDIDLRGVIHGTKHAIRAMKGTGGGSIVNWSSLAGLNASLQTAVYSAAKAGVIAVTKAAAAEYGGDNIRANAICPGVILTEMLTDAGMPEIVDMLARNSSLGRGGQPEEVAELASFLCSDRAAFISGAVIPIDGGNACRLP